MQIRKGKKISRMTALACAAVLALSTALGGCGKKEPEEMEEKDTSILVEVEKPKTASIELEGDFVGTVETDNEIMIIPKVAGDVTATYFEVGDHVEAGDLLFTVDDTSARISMEQAQASLASANASVSSAQTNVTLQELNLLYTQEQIKQSIGQIDTNEMQLENAVASAKYALKAAQENEQLAAEQFGLARDRYEDLEDDMDDLKDNAKHMEKYAKQLDEIKDNYNSIMNQDDSDDAKDYVENHYGLSVPDDVAGSQQKIANYYIYKMTGGAANDVYTLSVMSSSASNTASNMRSQRSTLDSSKDSLKLNMFSSAISKETAKNSVLSAEDAKRLAEKMLEDYELYTKAVILAGANYQLAGADAGQITANNSLAQAQAGARQAQAGVEAAQLQLDYTRVSSPVSGTITQKNIITNNMATQTTPAYVISADDASSIVFYVAQSVMEQLKVGEEIQVERNGEEYTAKISENTGLADAASGLFKVKAQLQGGAGRLVSGTSVKLTLATQKAQNVMTIPVDSVYYESQKAYVYVAQDGRAVKTEIEAGIANADSIEVKSGLSGDSQVIVTWAAQLKNGSEIRVKNAAQESKNGAPKGITDADADAEKSAASIEDRTDTALLRESIEQKIVY